MTFLDRLERRFGGLAIKNLTLWIIMGQVLAYGLTSMGFVGTGQLTLDPELVLHGQVWRLITFVLIPPDYGLIFMVLGWYVFFLIGRTLEGTWSEFRYNLYLLICVLAMIGASFVGLGEPAPYMIAGAAIFPSVFFAFAYLYPNVEFLMFFVIPAKVKWLAAFVWGMFLIQLMIGTPATRLMILASTLNFFLFFGPDMLRRRKAAARRNTFEAKRRVEAEQPFHRCCICGATDRTKPDDQFYYKEGRGYCEEHTALMDQPEPEQLAAAGGAFKE